MQDDDISARDFGAAFKGFLEQAATGVPVEEPALRPAASVSTSARTRPRSRLSAGSSTPSTVRTSRSRSTRSSTVRIESAEALGFSAQYSGFRATSITELIAQPKPGLFGEGGRAGGPGGVRERRSWRGKRRSRASRTALLLVDDRERPARARDLERTGPAESSPAKIELQAMAREREHADGFLAELKAEVRRLNVYRGRVITLGTAHAFGGVDDSLPSAAQDRARADHPPARCARAGRGSLDRVRPARRPAA